MTTNPQTCPKYLPADNPARIGRDLRIIEQAATGMPQGQIAALNGISRQRANQILTTDEAKETYDLIIQKHIANSPCIQDNLINIAKTKPGESEHIGTKDIIAATKEHNQIIGISGSHTQQNVFIGKYQEQNNTVIYSPDVLKLLAGAGHEAPIEIPGYDDEG